MDILIVIYTLATLGNFVILLKEIMKHINNVFIMV